MRIETLFYAAVFASALPVVAEAQHSHGGGGGMDQMSRPERRKDAPPKLPPGLLPVGSPRPIEVLVLDYGFSPKEIRADVGETVTLQVRRASPACVNGLSIPQRQLNLDLPLGETVPVTLELKQPGRLELKCRDEETAAVLIVGSP